MWAACCYHLVCNPKHSAVDLGVAWKLKPKISNAHCVSELLLLGIHLTALKVCKKWPACLGLQHVQWTSESAAGLCQWEKLSTFLLSPSAGVLCFHDILVVMPSPGKWGRELKVTFILGEVFHLLARCPAFGVILDNSEDSFKQRRESRTDSL